MRPADRIRFLTLAVVLTLPGVATGQTSFVAFESGPVRPIALSPSGGLGIHGLHPAGAAASEPRVEPRQLAQRR